MHTRIAIVVMLLLVLAAAPGADRAHATPRSTSSDFGTKANAICARAIAQKKAAHYVAPADPRAMTLAAVNGAKWLASDSAAYKALKALKAPAGNAADYEVMLTKRRSAIATLVQAVTAAKAGSRATFAALFLKSSTLAGGSGLRAWGMELKKCENWW